MSSTPDPTDGRRRRPADPLGEETRAYGTRLLFRLALAVALGAGVSLVAVLWAASGVSLWRLGALGLLLAAGIVGVLSDRSGQSSVARRAFVVLLLAGYLAAALATAFGGTSPNLIGLWLLAWFGVLVLAAGLLLGRVWALAMSVVGLGMMMFALVPTIGRAGSQPAGELTGLLGAEIVALSATALGVFVLRRQPGLRGHRPRPRPGPGVAAQSVADAGHAPGTSGGAHPGAGPGGARRPPANPHPRSRHLAP